MSKRDIHGLEHYTYMTPWKCCIVLMQCLTQLNIYTGRTCIASPEPPWVWSPAELMHRSSSIEWGGCVISHSCCPSLSLSQYFPTSISCLWRWDLTRPSPIQDITLLKQITNIFFGQIRWNHFPKQLDTVVLFQKLLKVTKCSSADCLATVWLFCLLMSIHSVSFETPSPGSEPTIILDMSCHIATRHIQMKGCSGDLVVTVHTMAYWALSWKLLYRFPARHVLHVYSPPSLPVSCLSPMQSLRALNDPRWLFKKKKLKDEANDMDCLIAMVKCGIY